MDRHKIKKESIPELNKLCTLLKNSPKFKISIEGHVCCIREGTDALDLDNNEQALSLNRAKCVYEYLVKKGVDASKLTYKGFGRSKPIIANELTYEDATVNRRVEIRIIEN